MKRTLLIISALALMCIGVRAQNLKATVNGAPIEMIEVEGGTFMMGDHMEQRADALPLPEVTLDTYYIGRTEFDSPEVDGEVLIDKSKPLTIGSFYNVEIISAMPFDLMGAIV